MLLINTKETSARPHWIFWPLLVLGIILAADGAAALVLQVLHYQWGSGFPFLYLVAPLAALLVGVPAWYRFIIVPGRATVQRGMALGAVCSIIAHPVMWTLLAVPALVSPSAEMQPSLWLIEVIYSLILGGWITTPVGAVAGVLLIHLQHAMTSSRRRKVSKSILENRQREMSSREQK